MSNTPKTWLAAPLFWLIATIAPAQNVDLNALAQQLGVPPDVQAEAAPAAAAPRLPADYAALVIYAEAHGAEGTDYAEETSAQACVLLAKLGLLTEADLGFCSTIRGEK